MLCTFLIHLDIDPNFEGIEFGSFKVQKDTHEQVSYGLMYLQDTMPLFQNNGKAWLFLLISSRAQKAPDNRGIH